MSQSSRVAWRGLRPLYPIPYKQTMAKTLLQDREARSLTSSSSIIYYLLGAGVTPTRSSGNETRKPQALLNLLFFLWLNKAEAWLWPPFFFSPKCFFSLRYLKIFYFYQRNVKLNKYFLSGFFSPSVVLITEMLWSVNLSTERPEGKFIPRVLIVSDPIQPSVLLLGLPIGLPFSAFLDSRIFHANICLGKFDRGYQLFPWLLNNGAWGTNSPMFLGTQSCRWAPYAFSRACKSF